MGLPRSRSCLVFRLVGWAAGEFNFTSLISSICSISFFPQPTCATFELLLLFMNQSIVFSFVLFLLAEPLPRAAAITHQKKGKKNNCFHHSQPSAGTAAFLFFTKEKQLLDCSLGQPMAAAFHFSSFSSLGRAEMKREMELLMAGCIKSHPIHKLIPFHSSQLSSNSSCLSFMVEFIS